MSELSKEDELVNFINSKVISKKKIEYNLLLFNYCKIMKEVILKCYKRLNVVYLIHECMTLVSNVFWCIFMYTYNIKLTMFLCERAILLFNEYIDLAKFTINETDEFKINSTDVKLFIYKRTIGPIVYKKQSIVFIKKINVIKQASIVIDNILTILITIIIKQFSSENKNVINDNLTKFIVYFHNLIPSIFYKLYKNNLIFNIDFLNYKNIQNSNDILKIINKIKLDCELLYIYFKLYKNINNMNLKSILMDDENLIDDVMYTNNFNAFKNKYILYKINKFKNKIKIK